MQRNWDCIRAILLAIEGLGNTQSHLEASAVDGYDSETVSYHIRMLIEAGLVEGKCIQGISGPVICHASRLTWEGHEFLDKIRSNSVWNKVKGIAREKGLSMSFDVIKMAAVHVISSLLG
ncbi:DNA-binding transcriptional ArsR family regulator [Herbaspirillum sp. Sphag1AN]|uniref:DUF2513 domain-containing protein n=1 Tax=unclassified Herbaspirillum TaxID=2624150 RepID=UPI00160A48FF|nr:MULTISPECIES: DUF2513 domain-containing protein [unclassified Herbaspirillum]MBB3213421.1 DNA-binding transcriptional ArsR family regulator [Herbaspirillum sp. Sphag1AN]MBB3246535.1 DNA-binding transcriptional ArsR family regulator [Herbaspirillum sp. Sphag64]